MLNLIRTLRQRLSELEARPWGAFLMRLVLAFLVLYPWGWCFVPVSFRVEDVDPVLVAACKAEGIDLFNRAIWATAGPLWMRWGWILLGAAMAWWLLSRIVRFIQQRFGLGWALLPILLGAVLLVLDAFSLSGRLLHGIHSNPYGGAHALWGGWLYSSAFQKHGLADHLRAMAMVFLFFEPLLAAGTAQRLLEETRALVLRSSLAPHFLYNGLNALHGLVDEDPKAAQSGLERLGRLLRRLLESSTRPRHSLAQELAFVEDYLGLERARLGDRLRVVLDIPEELTACAVPVLGLQVLVENAVKHAVAPLSEGGTVRIAAQKVRNGLVLSVEDPGMGLGNGKGLGLALENLRSRLHRPKDLVLERMDTGHRVSFRVPLEVA